MAKYSKLQSFYASERWRDFRVAIILERGLRCEYCNKAVHKASDLTLHHIIELTPENVDDSSISLNPENIQVVHHDCHNKIHKRFGYSGGHSVYVVYGPPLAGMKQFVSKNMQRGDMIVDMDSLYEAVTMLPCYDKPDSLFRNIRGIYNQLIDNIKTRYGKWNTAWIICGGADKHKREKLVKDLGAELVFCSATKEECMDRLKQFHELRHRQDEWQKYINKWFMSYIE